MTPLNISRSGPIREMCKCHSCPMDINGHLPSKPWNPGLERHEQKRIADQGKTIPLCSDYCNRDGLKGFFLKSTKSSR